MPLQAVTEEMNEFIRYARKARMEAACQIDKILYAERDNLRALHGIRSNIRSVRAVKARRWAYMDAVNSRLDNEAWAKFKMPLWSLMV